MEQLSSSIQKARKSHRCMWCGCEIEKGTVYRSQGCKCDGELYTWKNHLECEELADENDWFDDPDGLSESVFIDILSDLVSDLDVNTSLSKFEQVKACIEAQGR